MIKYGHTQNPTISLIGLSILIIFADLSLSLVRCNDTVDYSQVNLYQDSTLPNYVSRSLVEDDNITCANICENSDAMADYISSLKNDSKVETTV
jgi:hypothetical protein